MVETGATIRRLGLLNTHCHQQGRSRQGGKSHAQLRPRERLSISRTILAPPCPRSLLIQPFLINLNHLGDGCHRSQRPHHRVLSSSGDQLPHHKHLLRLHQTPRETRTHTVHHRALRGPRLTLPPLLYYCTRFNSPGIDRRRDRKPVPLRHVRVHHPTSTNNDINTKSDKGKHSQRRTPRLLIRKGTLQVLSPLPIQNLSVPGATSNTIAIRPLELKERVEHHYY